MVSVSNVKFSFTMKRVNVPTFHSVKEPSKNHDIWVPVMFGSLRGRVGFGSGSCTFFLLSGSCSVLGRTWVLVRFVLAGFGFCPISSTVSK